MQHFDGWNTLEGRHLVFVYAFVIVAQAGYFTYVAINWLRLRGLAERLRPDVVVPRKNEIA